ncbi:hypothetical protein OV079_21800 [Nannocystis pusilla]|uniref:Secreted protein n=1 Tax=Nannocystis pusilla TaxID=889268 RepID=A0A9X3IX72_9BACT|nr:hypothetical protein [Nannocystis pusilla]MCY1008142.1 hypothetical protein [Nannocystis pusilla]
MRTPTAVPFSTRICLTPLLVSMTAPAARAAAANFCETVPMPPSTSIHVPPAPGRRHMLWTRKFMPVPGVSQVP